MHQRLLFRTRYTWSQRMQFAAPWKRRFWICTRLWLVGVLGPLANWGNGFRSIFKQSASSSDRSKGFRNQGAWQPGSLALGKPKRHPRAWLPFGSTLNPNEGLKIRDKTTVCSEILDSCYTHIQNDTMMEFAHPTFSCAIPAKPRGS